MTTQQHAKWGKAGQRLTEAQSRQRAFAIRQRGHATVNDLEQSYERWRNGMMVPWRITHALDAGRHEGPHVDLACGAVEPAVDEWETGTRYPTWEQVGLLAKFTGYPIAFFFHESPAPDIQASTLWIHMSQRERERYRAPVEEFDVDAASRCAGTYDYEETHLF